MPEEIETSYEVSSNIRQIESYERTSPDAYELTSAVRRIAEELDHQNTRTSDNVQAGFKSIQNDINSLYEVAGSYEIRLGRLERRLEAQDRMLQNLAARLADHVVAFDDPHQGPGQ